MKALALALIVIHLPFGDDQRSATKGPLGNDPVAVSLPTSSAVQAVDRGSRGVAIVRRGGGASVTLARVKDPVRNDIHASQIAVSGTTWVAAITGGRLDGNQGEGGEYFDPTSQVVVTGSLSGGPVKRLTSCKTSRGELSVAVSGADVAYSGAHCSRGVWLVPATGPRVRLAARGDVRGLSASAALLSDRLVFRSGGGVRLPHFGAAAFDDDGTLLTLDGERLSRVGVDGTVAPLGEIHNATGDLAVGAGRALVGQSNGLVLVNTMTGLSSVPASGPAYPLAVDATRAAWLGEFEPGQPAVFIDDAG